MYATLQTAPGTWPSDRSFTAEQADGDGRTSGSNETFNFENDNPPELVPPMFTSSPDSVPSGRVFIPPFFVPPGEVQNSSMSYPGAVSDQSSPQYGQIANASNGATVTGARSTVQGNIVLDRSREESISGSSVPVQDRQHDDSLPMVEPRVDPQQTENVGPRSPSPPPSAELETECTQLWSAESRKAFHEMVTQNGHVNRYRLHMKKRERMMQYLQNPDKEPLLCDGSRDHQTKYQAAHWIVLNGKLYRRPESGRVPQFRRHLDGFEAWDVLTMEHVRSGHLGRDKLRKVLEQKYIGYTLQEIMFILKECKKCAGRGPNAERKDSDEDVQMTGTLEMEEASTAGGTRPSPAVPSAPASVEGPYGRKQSSNFMWF